MTSKTRRRGFLLAGLVLGLVAFAATGWARPGHDPGRKIDHLERMVSDLEVSPEVEASIGAILDEARAEQEARHEALRAAREQMRALMDADAPDEEAVFAHADHMGALKTETRKAQLSTLLEVRALLSPEQREDLRERMHARRGFHGKERR